MAYYICPGCSQENRDTNPCPHCGYAQEKIDGASLIAELKLKRKKNILSATEAKSIKTPKSKRRKLAVLSVLGVFLVVLFFRWRDFRLDMEQAEDLVFAQGQYEQALEVLGDRAFFFFSGRKDYFLLRDSALFGKSVEVANGVTPAVLRPDAIEQILNEDLSRLIKHNFPEFHKEQVSKLLAETEAMAQSLLGGEGNIFLLEDFMASKNAQILREHSKAIYEDLSIGYKERIDALLVEANSLLENKDNLILLETFITSPEGQLIERQRPAAHSRITSTYKSLIERLVVAHLRGNDLDRPDVALLPKSVHGLLQSNAIRLIFTETSKCLDILREMQSALDSGPAQGWAQGSHSALGRYLTSLPSPSDSPLRHYAEHVRKHYAAIASIVEMGKLLSSGDAWRAKAMASQAQLSDPILCHLCPEIDPAQYDLVESLTAFDRHIRKAYSENWVALELAIEKYIKESIDFFGNEVKMSCCPRSLAWHLSNAAHGDSASLTDAPHSPVAELRKNNSLDRFVKSWSTYVERGYDDGLRTLYTAGKVIVFEISHSSLMRNEKMILPRLSPKQSGVATFKWDKGSASDDLYSMPRQKTHWVAVVVENELSLTMSGAISEPELSGYVLCLDDDYFNLLKRIPIAIDDRRKEEERKRWEEESKCKTCFGRGDIAQSVTCSTCNGWGESRFTGADCPDCGWLTSGRKGRHVYSVTCPDCRGTGRWR